MKESEKIIGIKRRLKFINKDLNKLTPSLNPVCLTIPSWLFVNRRTKTETIINTAQPVKKWFSTISCQSKLNRTKKAQKADENKINASITAITHRGRIVSLAIKLMVEIYPN